MHDEGKHRDDNAGGSEPPDDVDFFGHGQHRPFWSCDTTAAPTLTRNPPIRVSFRLKARHSSRIDPTQDHGMLDGRAFDPASPGLSSPPESRFALPSPGRYCDFCRELSLGFR